MLVITALVVAYSVYLDAIIQSRFNGNKWEVPAQIYARPLSLYPGLEIDRQELIDELELLSYRRVERLHQSGEYAASTTQVHFVRRAFEFADGFQDEQYVAVVLADGKVQRINDLKSGQSLPYVQLEPWLISRLTTSSQEDRMLVQLDNVPSALIDALLLVEDRDFYQHYGVKPLAIIRALITNIRAGRNVQGGSTLTQQLVKNFFLSREKSILRKINEAWMSLIIEARYSKQVILQAYLNEVFLGQNGATGVHGFGLASHFYFDRPLNELNVGEIATLVGMVKGPSYYNPRRHPQRVMQRRDLILRMMMDAGYITKSEYQHQVKAKLQLASENRLAQGKHPAYMDQVKRELKQALQTPELFSAGIKVFTAMDPIAQKRAELSVRHQIPILEQRKKIQQLQGAVMVSDIHSGEIRAIVGGRQTDFQGFNRALDASRSVGSIIKPAIYLTALSNPQQFNLASLIEDEPIAMQSSGGQIWRPLNADKKFRGQVNLITALSHSLNVPTVNLGMQVGLDQVTQTLHQLGIEQSVPQYPAMLLGAVNFSPIQVNQMYQVIGNQGQLIPLHSLLAVTSNDNRLVWRANYQAQQRIDAGASYLVNYALHKVTTEGTAKTLKKLFPRINLAGKTGTTDDYRDSWFSGFDRNTVTTVWLGKDDNQSTGLTGASGALQVFKDYLQRQHPKSLVRGMPNGINIAHFDAATGAVVNPGCPDSISLPAIIDLLPAAQSCKAAVNKPQETKQAPQNKSWWQRLFGDD
nr:penicillin-binding protein 1B [Neptunicella marina]